MKRRLTIGIALLAFFLPSVVFAADPKPTIADPGYRGVMVKQSVPDGTKVEAGDTLDVTFTFRNKGTKAWSAAGNGYISAYTMEPRYRTSVFESDTWLSARQPAKISSAVAPGEQGSLTISFTAPDKPGTYKEEFYLAAENKSWVEGGYFYIELEVVPKLTPAVAAVPEVAKPALMYKANLFIQNKKAVSTVGGEEISVVIGYQNLGEKPWNRVQLRSRPGLALASGAALTFADHSWSDASTALDAAQKVDVGAVFRDTLTFRAPIEAGEYDAVFGLTVDGEEVPGADVRVRVSVTANAPDHYQPPFAHEAAKTIPSGTYRLTADPRIRVGLWKPEDFVQFKSTEDAYDVYTGTIKVGTLPKAALGVLKFRDGHYVFTGGGMEILSPEYIRLSPVNDPSSIFTLINYDRQISWKGPGSFNVYRGAIEYRRGEKQPDLWIINDLLMEDYVKGIGENIDSSPLEYLKAQTVAQRTYAYVTKQSNKYGVFDVVATTGDQLYVGYRNETYKPNFVRAAESTRGNVVTYNDEIVITPYFAHTGGITNAWHEVWGGAVKPWLVSVRTEYDARKYSSDFGHGVGMSQVDAAMRADEEGLTFDALLKYYYTGTKVEKIYQ